MKFEQALWDDGYDGDSNELAEWRQELDADYDGLAWRLTGNNANLPVDSDNLENNVLIPRHFCDSESHHERFRKRIKRIFGYQWVLDSSRS